MPLSVLVSPRTSTGAAIIQPCVTRSGFSCSLALAACGDPTSATDSASNSSITVRADGLLLELSGVQTDSLTTTLISGWGGAVERAGTFSLTIDADGFLPWRQDGIVVTKGLCHVRQMRVIARLVRR